MLRAALQTIFSVLPFRDKLELPEKVDAVVRRVATIASYASRDIATTTFQEKPPLPPLLPSLGVRGRQHPTHREGWVSVLLRRFNRAREKLHRRHGVSRSGGRKTRKACGRHEKARTPPCVHLPP